MASGFLDSAFLALAAAVVLVGRAGDPPGWSRSHSLGATSGGKRSVRRVSPFAIVILLAPALAGCLGGAGPDGPAGADAPPVAPPEPLLAITDPAGDATQYNTEMLRPLAYKCRIAGGLPWAACATAMGWALDALPPATGGVPGPPQLDGTRVTFQETREHLAVRIEVVRLDETFVQDALRPGAPWAAWSVCWVLEDVRECAYFEAQNITGPYSAYDRYTDACNPYFWCSWQIAHELEFGTPGAIRLLVPRALVSGGSSGGVLQDPVFVAQTEPPVHDLGPAGMFSWEVSGPVQAFGRHDNAHDGYAADLSGPGSDVPLVLQAAARTSDDVPFGFDDAADAPTDRPDADVLRVEVLETPTHATLAARLAEMRNQPGDLEIGFAWGLPAGFVLEAFVNGDGGSWAAMARRCTFDGCGHPVPVDMALAAGSPGWVNLTFARVDLGSPAAGDLTTVLYAWSVFGETRAARGAGPFALRVTQGGTQAEFAGVAPPLWFRLGTLA